MVTTLAHPILHLLAGLLFVGIPAVAFALKKRWLDAMLLAWTAAVFGLIGTTQERLEWRAGSFGMAIAGMLYIVVRSIVLWRRPS